MYLYLLRHGIAAEPDSLRYPDDDRPLTDEGVEKMQRTAQGMKKIVDGFDLIIASPLLRTMQTAQIVANEFGLGNSLVTRDEVALGSSSKRIVSMLGEFQEMKHVLLVSHQPELVELFSTFTGARSESIEIKKGGLTCLVVMGLAARPRAALLWQLTSKHMRYLSGQ